MAQLPHPTLDNSHAPLRQLVAGDQAGWVTRRAQFREANAHRPHFLHVFQNPPQASGLPADETNLSWEVLAPRQRLVTSARGINEIGRALGGAGGRGECRYVPQEVVDEESRNELADEAGDEEDLKTVKNIDYDHPRGFPEAIRINPEYRAPVTVVGVKDEPAGAALGFVEKVKSFFSSPSRGSSATSSDQYIPPPPRGSRVVRVPLSRLLCAQEHDRVEADGTWTRSGSTPSLRVVCISDTHEMHEKMTHVIPYGDVLIHGGDFSKGGGISGMEAFLKWFRAHPHPVKILIAGNHDVSLDKAFMADTEHRRRFGFKTEYHPKEVDPSKKLSETLKDLYYGACVEDEDNRNGVVVYLDEETVDLEIVDDLEVAGAIANGEGGACGDDKKHDKNGKKMVGQLRFFGSPIQPYFGDWAFNRLRCVDDGKHGRNRDYGIAPCWDKIPTDTDVLITHGPPLGRGDKCHHGARAGCLDLLETVQERVKPRLHVFGHIHEDAGVSSDGTTLYANASTCTLAYRAENPPIVLDLEVVKGKKVGEEQVAVGK